jgi:AcrR family transcriptional regulator
VIEAETRTDVRGRIVEAAAGLLQEEGPGAVTTRGVAEAAGVQPPTIYRLFGDKDGLLEAVAEHVMATYVAAKTRAQAVASATEVDPIEDLRASWDLQVEFGLANPAVFRLFSEPGRVRQSAAARSGRRVLEARVHRVAAAGRLRVAEHRAVDLIQAAGVGTVQSLLATPTDRRDPELPDAMLETVLARILVDAPQRTEQEPIATAVAFRALARRLDALTAAERRLLVEWVDRAIDTL